MRIVDLQRRMVRLGKIRTGDTVEAQSKRGGSFRRPRKLETFRLTSASRELLEAAAGIYGGTVTAWPDAPAGEQWQVTTESVVLDVILAPGEPLDQAYELWAAKVCQRRCDGRTNYATGEPCECPADPAERRDLAAEGKACKPTTRLALVLPDVPGMGTWTLESHGYYAAVELVGTVEFLASLADIGRHIRARLRLEQREVRKPGEATRQFAVPVLDLPSVRVADLLAARTSEPEAIAAALPEPIQPRAKVPRPELPTGLPVPEMVTPLESLPGFGQRPMLAAEPPAHSPLESYPDPAVLTVNVFRDLAHAAGFGRLRVGRAADELWPERQLSMHDSKDWSLAPAEWWMLAERLGLVEPA